MAENVSIIIKAFDQTEAAFAGIRAQFAKLGVAADKLKKRFPTITASIGLMGGALKKAVKTMGSFAKAGAVGALGVGYLAKRSLDATDSLKKTADKIGTTTEALGALRYAANVSGVETRTLDMAMQRFTRRAAEAAAGTGEAKSAIRELGINAQDLNRMPLDEKMLTLADAFGGVSNESDKLRLAFKLFDSEGAALVNTLGLGKDGLAAMLGEARALGLTMSTSAAVGVEKTNDALLKLGGLFKGVTDQTVAALAPAIEMLVERFTGFLQRSIEAKGGIERFAKSLAIDLLNGIKIALFAFEDLANGFIKVYNGAVSVKNQLKDTFGQGTKSAAAYKKELAEIDDQMERNANATNLNEDKQMEVMDLLIARRKEALKLYHQAQDAEAKTPVGDVSFAGRLVGDLDALILSLSSTQDAIVNLPAAVVPALNNIELGFKSWSDTIPDLDTSIQALANQGLNGLTDALTAGVTGAANFADAMKAMAKSVVDSLIKMLIQKYIVDAAFGAITGFIGGSARMATGATGTMSGPASNYFVPSMSGKAIGGSVQGGQPYMVGERGPEMFVPNSQGSIVPNNRMGGGGGVVVNQTINVTTGVQQTVRAEIASLMPQIANAAKGAVADAKMRGGNYSKMLGA